eukprot:TRINITY_DN2922_c1_g1_i1.p1 TRINITY_DN2922_c1_g1~~TRINITY_DN2922_c1_g1_i1.p1  ORF type:complete len:503 (+),score=70.53 TRINITY_DN2922_c1_g1_i1:202-1509(+)
MTDQVLNSTCLLSIVNVAGKSVLEVNSDIDPISKLPLEGNQKLTIFRVKQCLQLQTCRSPYAQKLLHHQTLLDDDTVVASLGASAMLTLVLLPYEKDQGTELIAASITGDHLGVQSALEKRADPDGDGLEALTPLFRAASRGSNDHLKSVRLLCEAAADTNKCSRTMETPLYIAAHNGHPDVVNALCSYSASLDVAAWLGETPLYIASHNGHLDVVRILCEAKADQDKAEKDGCTPISVAAWRGEPYIVQFLCEAKADTNKAERDGSTPLIVAADEGHAKVVQVLCKAGAKINAINKEGSSAVTVASNRGHVDITRILCEFGADPSKLSNNVSSALSLAQSGHTEIQTILQQYLAENKEAFPAEHEACCQVSGESAYCNIKVHAISSPLSVPVKDGIKGLEIARNGAVDKPSSDLNSDSLAVAEGGSSKKRFRAF